jgi:hypothetical protein
MCGHSQPGFVSPVTGMFVVTLSILPR